jgi:hypothetical protein
VRAREATVAASAFHPGEEDDRAGQAVWAGQMPRPSGGWLQRPNWRGMGSGPARVEGEAGLGWVNPEPGQNSKRNSFRISIDFRIWQNFGKLYMEI